MKSALKWTVVWDKGLPDLEAYLTPLLTNKKDTDGLLEVKLELLL